MPRTDRCPRRPSQLHADCATTGFEVAHVARPSLGQQREAGCCQLTFDDHGHGHVHDPGHGCALHRPHNQTQRWCAPPGIVREVGGDSEKNIAMSFRLWNMSTSEPDAVSIRPSARSCLLISEVSYATMPLLSGRQREHEQVNNGVKLRRDKPHRE